MKKFLKIFLPMLLFIGLAYFGYQIHSKIKHKKEVANNIKEMPKFTFTTIEGKTLTNKDLLPNYRTIFVYFNTTCDYCSHETQIFKDNLNKLDNYQIFFVSFETPEIIKPFAQQYQLLNHDKIHFITDPRAIFSTTFDVKSIPSIVLYDENHKLVEVIKGQVKIETILGKYKASIQ
jgi:peroxiredoxin